MKIKRKLVCLFAFLIRFVLFSEKYAKQIETLASMKRELHTLQAGLCLFQSSVALFSFLETAKSRAQCNEANANAQRLQNEYSTENELRELLTDELAKLTKLSQNAE